MPLGQMPVLDVTDSSGKTERYTQTCSLIRMTGEWFGLAGETQIQKARIDEAAECIFEVFAAYARGNWEKDEARKAEMIAAFRDNLIPRIFKYLDGAVAGNGGKNIAGTDKVGSTVSLFTFFSFFFSFSQFSFADLALVTLLDDIHFAKFYEWSELENQYPNLAKLKKSIESTPEIKAYLENREITPF